LIGLRRALWALAGIGLLVLIGQVILLSETDFLEDQGIWIALDIVIGAGFVGVGLFAWDRRPENRVGALMVAIGFAWFLSVFGNTEPALLFTVGNLFSNLFVAAAIHLLLAFPSGRLESNVDRWLVRVAYFVTAVGFLPVMLTFDPAAMEIPGAPTNLLLIEHHPDFAADWVDGLAVLGILVQSLVIARLVARWRAATPPMRRIVTPVFLAGGLLMSLLGALLFITLFDDLSHEIGMNVYYVALIPFGLVPYLFLASLARARMLRGGAVGELVSTLGRNVPAPELRDALARALNDPSLDLAYWLSEEEGYVDARGRGVELPGTGSDRAVSDVQLNGHRVATLIHDPLLLDDPELIHAVGAAAGLALEKERLDAELRAKVEALRESRSRLLQVGLSERRRLERNLHDGAQQRLGSLALDLRLARSAIEDDPDRARELLDGAGDELERALEELRELARGIHPAVLTDRGIDSAIEALAGRTPLPVEIDRRLGERVSEPVELAAYFVVSEALTNVVKYASASRASISLERGNGSVRVEVADDGVGGADPSRGSGLRGLADRISVLGGKLEVTSPPGQGTKVIARLPCE
jgi:signal transduction histidine kinase